MSCMFQFTNAAGTVTLTTVWQHSRSVDSNVMPDYFSLNVGPRGMALGTVDGKKVLIVPVKDKINILNPATGEKIGNLDVTGITTSTSGSYPTVDAGISEDGIIFTSNMATVGVNNLKIHQWNSLTSTPILAIDYPNEEGSRYGDQITVTGSISDGSAKIYVCSEKAIVTEETYIYRILEFSMIEDTGNPGSYIFSNEPAIFSDAIDNTGGAPLRPSMDFLPNGNAIYKGKGRELLELASDGEPTGKLIGTDILESDGLSPKFITSTAEKLYVGIYDNVKRAATIASVNLSDWSEALLEVSTPTLGKTNNANGTGRLIVEHDNEDIYLYVVGTNNGIGKYKLTISDVASSIINKRVDFAYSLLESKLHIYDDTISSIDVYNEIGQKVMGVSNSNFIDLNGLKGVALIKITSTNGKAIVIKAIL